MTKTRKTTVADKAREAVENNDAALALKVADFLRARGLNYRGVYALVHRVTGIDLAAWDALLYEAEAEKGREWVADLAAAWVTK